MSPSVWEYWKDLGSGLIGAVLLLVTGDSETWVVIRQSLLISLGATVPSVLVGIPLGAWMALSSFRGRNLILTSFNVGFGLPPVVVGLILSILLLRHGPLGSLNLRFTPWAMIMAQFILSCPIIISLAAAAIQQLDPKLKLANAGTGRVPAPDALVVRSRGPAAACSLLTWPPLAASFPKSERA